MGNKIIKTKENIADKLEFPRDIILNIPRIIISGDSEITIENHKGIVLFEETIIKIESSVGLISIYGKSMEISFIGGSTITLNGIINSVIYEKNEII